MRLRKLNSPQRRAELVVERMDLGVLLLADVAVLRLDQLAQLGLVDVGLLEVRRRHDVRRRVHRLLAQHADAGLRERRLVARELRRLLLAAQRLGPEAALHEVGVVDVAGGGEQPRAFLDRERAEQAAVADDRLEQLGRLPQARGEVVVRCRLAS